jgi:Asp-tRNA(Asn)/Glu-tRNA(Gln) amidotransferase A subunit family amidase
VRTWPERDHRRPEQDIEDSRDQLKKLLANQGYEVGDIEFPEITASAIPPWAVSNKSWPPIPKRPPPPPKK